MPEVGLLLQLERDQALLEHVLTVPPAHDFEWLSEPDVSSDTLELDIVPDVGEHDTYHEDAPLSTNVREGLRELLDLDCDRGEGRGMRRRP